MFRPELRKPLTNWPLLIIIGTWNAIVCIYRAAARPTASSEKRIEGQSDIIVQSGTYFFPTTESSNVNLLNTHPFVSTPATHIRLAAYSDALFTNPTTYGAGFSTQSIVGQKNFNGTIPGPIPDHLGSNIEIVKTVNTPGSLPTFNTSPNNLLINKTTTTPAGPAPAWSGQPMQRFCLGLAHVLLALAAAGCGGDSSSGDAPGGPPTAPLEPFVRIVSPVDGDVVSGSVPVEFEVQLPEDALSVELGVDGQLLPLRTLDLVDSPRSTSDNQ